MGSHDGLAVCVGRGVGRGVGLHDGRAVCVGRGVGRGVGLHDGLSALNSVKLAATRLTFVPRHFDNALSYVFSCIEAFKAMSAWPSILLHISIVLKNS